MDSSGGGVAGALVIMATLRPMMMMMMMTRRGAIRGHFWLGAGAGWVPAWIWSSITSLPLLNPSHGPSQSHMQALSDLPVRLPDDNTDLMQEQLNDVLYLVRFK